jgi:glycosyltransferase involved in cell wall biosynthesis
MRIALIHYWLLNWRGGERVLKAIADIFPQADIYTHVYDPALVQQELPGRKIRTSFIGQLPFARRHYQKYLPLMPLALEQLDLRDYDLVISNESGPAKGVIVGPNTQHLCYCLSPMRYLWDMYPDYRASAGTVTRAIMGPMMHYLRLWDQLSAQRVDQYVAISRFVAARIEKYYRRHADIIYPPVSVDDFTASLSSDDYYLSVGQLVAYKKADLMVEAFNLLGKRLVVIGEGELMPKLRRLAKSNIQLLGRQPFDVIRDYYSRCRALVFPGIEDFGIVPVEAMASGKPVIAFAAGGALDTVIDGSTGLLFSEQSLQGLVRAVLRFEEIRDSFDPVAIRAHAEQFSTDRFTAQFRTCVNTLMQKA